MSTDNDLLDAFDDADLEPNEALAPSAKPAAKPRPSRAKPAAQAPAATEVADPNAVPKGLVRIILEESDAVPPGGLFVGANGRNWTLPAGRPIDVPQVVLNVLDLAVYLKPVQDDDGVIVGHREALRFPYRTVRGH